MGELIDRRLTIKAIRDVSYEDLMGRESIQLEIEKIGEYLRDKSILITGAGGSIGSELCRQIARFFPENLILVDRTENNLYEIESELRKDFPYLKFTSILGNVLNQSVLRTVFSKHKPKAVFHAAAYKHVPMMELNPWEAIFTNVKGTHSLLEVVKEFEVDRFVLVSTDKAVRPANVMGASKRVSELLTQCYNGRFNPTRFMSVRFGNVIGSSGSVIPLFKRQIERGGPVTVTHPEVTRYFMTIPEAAQLILQAGAMGEGGEIFILDMGSPIKILDLARDLIRLSGFEPDEDIEIKFIGLRPGEKLYEAPRTSPWSPKTIPTYAPGRCSASVRKRQGSRLPKNLFGEQVVGSSAGERNPPKHGRFIAGRVPIQSYAFLRGQSRGLLRRRMKNSSPKEKVFFLPAMKKYLSFVNYHVTLTG